MAGTIVFDTVLGETETPLLSGQVRLPRPQGISIKSNTQTYKSVSQNLSVETRSRGIQRWEVTLDFPPMTREDAMRVYSFIISQQGSFETFQFRMPSPLNSTNGSQVNNTTVEGTPQVVDTRANIARTIDVANFNRSTTAMKAGDLFKFASHEKIYMVTQDLNTDDMGTGVLRFTPPLLQKGAAGTSGGGIFSGGDEIIFTDFDMSSSLIEDEFEFPIDENVFYTMSVRFGERVNVTNTTT